MRVCRGRKHDLHGGKPRSEDAHHCNREGVGRRHGSCHHPAHKKTGQEVRYAVSDTWRPKLIEINKQFDPAGRYEQIMKADGLFEVSN